MKLTRRNQLWVLIFLTSFTTCLQYTLQGALATDAEIALFPDAFWVADYGAWGGRALVEAWVVAYVFTTVYHNWAHRVLITFVEVVMLLLIAATLGPTFYAIGSGQKIYEALVQRDFWLWNYGIAAYPSIMMAATGIAYRIMPKDIQAEPSEARRGIDVLRELLETPTGLDAEEVLRLVASRVSREDRPTPAALADMLDVHPATVARVYQEEAENE